MSVADMVTLIAAVSAALVAVINAVRMSKVSGKLDVIHDDTNGSLTHVKNEVATLHARLRRLGVKDENV